MNLIRFNVMDICCLLHCNFNRNDQIEPSTIMVFIQLADLLNKSTRVQLRYLDAKINSIRRQDYI